MNTRISFISYLAFIFLFGVNSLNAQEVEPSPSKVDSSSVTTIKGQITDKENGEAIPFANVVVKNSYGEVITGSSSDIDGHYLFPFPRGPLADKGMYWVEVSCIGYETQKVGLDLNTDNYTWINLQLIEDKNLDLSGVVNLITPSIISPSYRSGEVFDQEDIQTVYRQ